MSPSLTARRCLLLLLAAWPTLAAAADPVVTVPRLRHHGGRVLEQVQVVPVFWGPAVFPEARAGLGGFYRAAVRSSFFDFLDDYDVTLDGGTRLHIGPGTAADPVTIAPGNGATAISDAALTQELAAQILAGHLPAPDPQTLYLVHFPPGLELIYGQLLDCSVPLGGKFCGYHASASVGGLQFLFGALPDLSQGLCATRCSKQATPFDALTNISAHELFEAVTDPVPGTGWYDSQTADPVSLHAEIGDACELPYGTEPRLGPGDGGLDYVMQREWSNRHQGCIVSRDDVFPVTVGEATPTARPGQTATVSLSIDAPVNVLDGDVQVVVAGLPVSVDVVATVRPGVLRPGKLAQLELAVGPSVPADTYPLELLFVSQRAALFRPLTLAVVVDDGPLTLQPAALRLDAGASATLAISGEVPVGADGGTVLALSVEGLPPGLQATFAPPTLLEGKRAELTLTALPGAPPAHGVAFTVVADAVGARRTAVATVDADGDDFGVALAAAGLALVQGSTVQVQVRTTATGTPRRLTLGLSSAPPDTVGVFNPETVLAGESSTLTLFAGATAALGAHPLVVNARGPFTTRTAEASVSTTAPSTGCGVAGGAPGGAALAGLALLGLLSTRRRAPGRAPRAAAPPR